MLSMAAVSGVRLVDGGFCFTGFLFHLVFMGSPHILVPVVRANIFLCIFDGRIGFPSCYIGLLDGFLRFQLRFLD